MHLCEHQDYSEAVKVVVYGVCFMSARQVAPVQRRGYGGKHERARQEVLSVLQG